ncbi:hypothetical protein Pgy4_37401, partial [Pseudomonas savastanoi pv. glycinea str. race 4]
HCQRPLGLDKGLAPVGVIEAVDAYTATATAAGVNEPSSVLMKIVKQPGQWE